MFFQALHVYGSAASPLQTRDQGLIIKLSSKCKVCSCTLLCILIPIRRAALSAGVTRGSRLCAAFKGSSGVSEVAQTEVL